MPAARRAASAPSSAPKPTVVATLAAAVVNMRVYSSSREGSPTQTSHSWRRNSRPEPQPWWPVAQVATSR